MNELSRRLLTSIVFLICFLLALFHPTWGPHFAFLLILTAISVGTWELYDIIERKNIVVWRRCGVFSGVLLALAGYNRVMGFVDIPLEMLAILFLFFSTFFYQLTKGTKDAIPSIMGTIFGAFYVAVPLACLFWIYSLEQGRWWLLFLFLVTCFNDIGAYFIGSKFGKTPLYPKISPKKSLEGALGGMVSGMVAMFVLGLGIQFFSEAGNFYWASATLSTYSQAFLLSLLLSVVGIAGDLSESMLKRDAGVKDSGNPLTGHGGMLDMVDSLLFTVPLTFFYAKVISLLH